MLHWTGTGTRKWWVSILWYVSWWMGCLPFSPPWLHSDSHQALYELGYQCYTFPPLCTLCKWWPPGTTISSHIVTGVGACEDTAHVCPTQIFYKRGAHQTSRLTFQLTVGWDTSCTATLPIGTAEHLVHINKQILLVTLSFCLPI